jgi:hypothetical protein
MIAAVPRRGAAAAGWRQRSDTGPQDVPRGDHIPVARELPAAELNSSFYPALACLLSSAGDRQTADG